MDAKTSLNIEVSALGASVKPASSKPSPSGLALLDQCVEDGLYPSRSAVLLRALRLLKSADLGKMYAEAFDEWNISIEGKEWDALDVSRDVSQDVTRATR